MEKEECHLPDTKTTLQQLCQLIGDVTTVGQVQRQLILLQAFFDASDDTAKIEDLDKISVVLNFLSSWLSAECRYTEPLWQLLLFLKHPPCIKKTSDNVAYSNCMVQYFSALGNVLLWCETNKPILLATLDIVHNLLSICEPNDLSRIRHSVCVQAMEVSTLMSTLSDLLVIVSPDIYEPVLNIVLRTAILSKNCCWSLLKEDALESLLCRLTWPGHDRNYKILETTSQILWRLLHCTGEQEDWNQINEPTVSALKSLQQVFTNEVLKHTEPGLDKVHRNDITALLIKMMLCFPNIKFSVAGISEVMVLLSVATEIDINKSWAQDIIFTNDKCDLRFKKLLLVALCLRCKTPLTVQFMKETRAAGALAQLIVPDKNAPMIWEPEQRWQLLQYIFPLIADLFPLLTDSFIEHQLINKMMILVKMFYSEGCLDAEIVLHCFKTVHMMCLFGKSHHYIISQFTDNHSIEIFLDISKKIISPNCILTSSYQNLLTHVFCILALLLKPEVQEHHGDTLIQVIHNCCHRILVPLPQDTLLDNRLLVSFGNFMWQTVVLCEKNALTFINHASIYLILDILQIIEMPVKLVFLSLLIDLCEYEESVSYLVTWHSKKNSENLLTMLCHPWRQEEKALGVKRTADGCISDIEQPLMGQKQNQLSKKTALVDTTSPAILDIMASVRPKIYALTELLCHHHEEVTKLAEEHYKLGYNTLSDHDQITFLIIRSYLPMKMGEVWKEHECRQCNTLPLDRYLTSTLTARYQHWAIYVKHKQNEVLKKAGHKLQEEEQSFYSLFNMCNLTAALEALKDIHLIARTSDRKMLLHAKEQQQQQIAKSRIYDSRDTEITYIENINITTMSAGRNVKIKSKPLPPPVSQNRHHLNLMDSVGQEGSNHYLVPDTPRTSTCIFYLNDKPMY